MVENGTFLIDTEGEIGSILDDFASTDLTREEAEFLRRLREQFIGLTPSDVHITNTGYINDKEQLIIQIDGIKKTLDSLEEIQLEESGQLTKLSEKSLKVNMMLSNLEVGFLIVIAVSILMLVFQPIKTLYPIR